MTLPLPMCAWCGLTLKRSGETHSGRVLIEMSSLGSPVVGWHGDCAADDLAFKRCQHDHDASAMLRSVLRRGNNRVSARKAFWNKKEAKR